MYAVGQKINVRCPVYRNGRKFTGNITSIHEDYCMIKIDGNSKSTRFANRWIEPLKTPYFSPLTKALFNL